MTTGSDHSYLCNPEFDGHYHLLKVYIKSLPDNHMATKLIQAIPEMPKPVTDSEVERFLESKLNMQLAALDEEGYPNIQPVWFYYDKGTQVIYTGTRKGSKKVQNIRRDPDKIYFSIDDENYPYKGGRG